MKEENSIWEEIQKYLENGTSEIISSGYKKLDSLLGGGFVKGSTNLVIEESGVRGQLFLILLLRKRVEKYGDKGIIDCFSLSPEELTEYCRAYNINLNTNNGDLYFVDFSSEDKVRKALGTTWLDSFAYRYIKTVCDLIPNGNIFNIVLSLSALATRYGEKRIYNHLLTNKRGYESFKRTALYLIRKSNHSNWFVECCKDLFDTVITLNAVIGEETIENIIQIDKSPLLNFSGNKIQYKISNFVNRERGEK